MDLAGTSPSAKEIEEQLRRMLSSKRFLNATNQSAFLALVVRRAIQGRKSPGHVIAKHLFGHKFLKAESTDVRVTAGNLRATLRRYYSEEGRDDLVVVSLPDPPPDKSVKLKEGEAYTPVCSYSAAHAFGKELRLAKYHLEKPSYEDIEISYQHFMNVLSIVPNHVEATLGLVELLGLLDLWVPCKIYRSGETSKDTILSLLHRIESQAASNWKFHALSGLWAFNCGDRTKARKCYDTALSLDRDSTEAFPQYHHHLRIMGKRDEAYRLSKKAFDLNNDKIPAHMDYASILFHLNKSEECTSILEDALKIDSGNCYIHLFLAEGYYLENRIPETLHHLEYVRLLGGPIMNEIVLEKFGWLDEEWKDKTEVDWSFQAKRLQKMRRLESLI